MKLVFLFFILNKRETSPAQDTQEIQCFITRSASILYYDMVNIIYILSARSSSLHFALCKRKRREIDNICPQIGKSARFRALAFSPNTIGSRALVIMQNAIYYKLLFRCCSRARGFLVLLK